MCKNQSQKNFLYFLRFKINCLLLQFFCFNLKFFLLTKIIYRLFFFYTHTHEFCRFTVYIHTNGNWKSSLHEPLNKATTTKKGKKKRKPWVNTYEFADSHWSALAILLALDLLLDNPGARLPLGRLLALLPLGNVPQTTLVEHAAARQTHHSRRLELTVYRLAGLHFLGAGGGWFSCGWGHF